MTATPPDLADYPPLLTRRQAAEIAQMSPATIDRHIRTGEIRAKRLGRGKKPPIRIPRDEFLLWCGLASRGDVARDTRRAAAEKHACLARLGGRATAHV